MSLPRPLHALHALCAAALAAAAVLGPAGAAAAEPVQPLPSADQLGSALLTANDLGQGFTGTPVTGSPAPSAAPTPVSGCAALSALVDMRATTPGPDSPRAETELDGPDGNPMVTEALAAEDPARLAADFGTVADALRTCHTITFNSSVGDTVTFTVTPVTLGDRPDAPAARLDGTLAGIQLTAFVGVERFGTVGLAYGCFQRQGADQQFASLQYRSAVAKVEHTLGTTAGSTTPPTATATRGMSV
ncbi:hypothetical protein AB0O91_34850 [Kitasatospora sp. NPDC089797]|uniref:hypothetical protein n=1 Tax=Kitasatospora sp. NPDC089797 TaxID=3155298 RepID=UPI003420EF56